MVSRESVQKIIGLLVLIRALVPFVYSRFNNIEDTGVKAVDDTLESLHDGAIKIGTFFWLIGALVQYIVLGFILGFLPDKWFDSKIVV